jgi:hypothetical protein
MTAYHRIDADKAHHSFKRLKSRQVRIVHSHLLKAVDCLMVYRAAHAQYGDDGVDILSLRQMSAVWALVALKRELQAEGY